MSTTLKLRGGTTAEHSTFTGEAREVTVDTQKNTVVVHDGSTVGGHPVANQADITSAKERANHTGTQAHTTITGLGTAATSNVTTSATDTTAGRLLKVGDGGLLGTVELLPQGHDWNDIPGRTFFLWGRGISDSLNGPEGMGRPMAFQIDAGLGRKFQLASRNNIIKFRSTSDNFESEDWQEIYQTGNVVGTVSQSGGVPTGAIIERGSNANGEFIRYADGTQICWKDNVSCVYATTASLTYDTLYPADFIASPSLSVSLISPFTYNGTQYSAGQVADGATRPLLRDFGNPAQRISFNIQRPSTSESWGSDDDLKASFTAIGRWY